MLPRHKVEIGGGAGGAGMGGTGATVGVEGTGAGAAVGTGLGVMISGVTKVSIDGVLATTVGASGTMATGGVEAAYSTDTPSAWIRV